MFAITYYFFILQVDDVYDYANNWMFGNILSKHFALYSVNFLNIIKQHLNQSEPEEEEYIDPFGALFGDVSYSYEESDSTCSNSSVCSQILKAINDGLNSLSWSVPLDLDHTIMFGSFASTFLPVMDYYNVDEAFITFCTAEMDNNDYK